MQNYEQLIIALCKGETPKEKYEWLIDHLHELQNMEMRIELLEIGLKESGE